MHLGEQRILSHFQFVKKPLAEQDKLVGVAMGIISTGGMLLRTPLCWPVITEAPS